MKEKLTEEKVAEIILARYESEGYHELTEEEERRGEEHRKKLLEYEKKMMKKKALKKH